ncbi:triose-phosphate transporter family-domain-containing protein [Stachybotrys elegans]|uniref:Triose-phosphate transporter family-domain-containing protein n=1 Tax=Stachybotrys elegans TaxID=80388 RepID=A0A8K0SPZ5_9HYPO|nr:triose-phosphate transporter family-domain-containing protein [Stachybotrys elegans]
MRSSSTASSPTIASRPSADISDLQMEMEMELPITDKPNLKSRGLHPAFYILNWIVFSNLTILFNKWLIDTAGFRYPILLTTWHLVFATAATQILARTTSLLDSRRTLPLSGRMYIRTILPIGFCYSGSLVCSNVVYLYLSVAFIQMLKAASPVAVLIVSWIWRVADPSLNKFLNILVIVLGVGLSSAGEIDFSMVGFMYQVGGIIFEALRLVMIQVMLSGEGLKMDPLVGLYYYAPVCAVMNFIVAIPTELPKFQVEDMAKAGYGMLLLNAMVAFMLNIASVFLIGKTSGLVMTLTGILKNILLVVISVMIWNSNITGLQCLGYAVALGGLTYYSLGYDQLEKGWNSSKFWASSVWNSENSQVGLRRGARRTIIVAVAAFFTLVLFGGVLHTTGVASKSVTMVQAWLGAE